MMMEKITASTITYLCVADGVIILFMKTSLKGLHPLAAAMVCAPCNLQNNIQKEASQWGGR